MEIRNVKKVLPYLLNARTVPFFWGSQGVGKTQTISQYCKENGLELVVLHTATQDVGDLIGLLVKSKDGQTVRHARPEWFPTEGKGIIFLDELNRAPTDVIQAMFPFIIEGKLHTHKLPDGWRIVAAGNYQSDRFQTTDTSDAAWLSRFCHIDFTPSVDEWVIHAENTGCDDLAAFIRENPSMLELDAKKAGRLDTSFIVPDRRAWLTGVAKLDEVGLPEEFQYEVYSGLVGQAAAAAYITSKHKTEKGIQLKQILKNYDKVKSRVRKLSTQANEQRFDILNQPVNEMMIKLEATPGLLTGNGVLENVKAFLLDIPRELSMKAFTKMATLPYFEGKNEILNDFAYVAKFN